MLFSNATTGGGGFLGLGPKAKDSGTTVEPGAGVEVRFEWKRGKVKGSGRGRPGKERSETGNGRVKKQKSTATATAEWENREEHEEDGQTERTSHESKMSEHKRLSRISAKSSQSIGSGAGDVGSEEGGERTRRRSLKRPTSAGVAGPEGMGGDGKDDGEESDPEDSETPWVCTLKVRRTAPTSSTSDGPPKHSTKAGGEKEVLKLKVGTLSPAPHHPKVVAMLKVPFPLPDLEVERLTIRRRFPGFIPGQGGVNELGEVGHPVPTARDFTRGTSAGQRKTQGDEYKGLTLTAEEIKDIVCSTALWLVVREGTGGVGRISRKGDGWKLRS